MKESKHTHAQLHTPTHLYTHTHTHTHTHRETVIFGMIRDVETASYTYNGEEMGSHIVSYVSCCCPRVLYVLLEERLFIIDEFQRGWGGMSRVLIPPPCGGLPPLGTFPKYNTGVYYTHAHTQTHTHMSCTHTHTEIWGDLQ